MEKLILNNCAISHIDSAIANLTNLKTLDLSDNFLYSHSLPNELGMLSSLDTLNLSWNYNLNKLPSSIVNLTDLKYLDLSYTGIEESAIAQLKWQLPNCEIIESYR